MKKVHCHLIIHSSAPHLNQIYSGFIELERMNFITISKTIKLDEKKQILEVIVDNKIKIIYDTMDEEEFYAHTKMNIKNIDYYFKRSFNREIANQYKFNCYPLGVNYNVYNKNDNLLGFNAIVKNKIKKILKNRNKDFYKEDFEHLPIATENPKICFLTRVWDTEAEDIENDKVREERININKFRIDCIKACREKFKENFIGGIESSEYAENNFPEYIIKDKSITSRDKYIDIMKNCDICIATTGLHKSIGWKFGEYIASSRAIVTEPLHYELPGNIKNNQNYIEFRSVEELVNIIENLIEDMEKREQVMINNYNYYHNYAKPEMIILNSLKIVFDN